MFLPPGLSVLDLSVTGYFKEKFENFNMPFGFLHRTTPCVETMPSHQKTMGVGVVIQTGGNGF